MSNNEPFRGSGNMDVDSAGPEGLLHSVTGWVCWVYALFLSVWYTLAFLEVTNPVNQSYLSVVFSSIGWGLALFHGIYYYAKQSPDVGAGLRSGQVTEQTGLLVRTARTDHVLLVVMVIIYSIWVAISYTQFFRTDGKGESGVAYLITNPDSTANMTGADLLARERHNNQMLCNFFFSVLVLIFGSIAWGIAAQVLFHYIISGGNLRRGYGGQGEYPLGGGTLELQRLAAKAGSVRV